METINYNIPSVSCSVCSNKIQEGVRELNGINDVSVDLKSQTVSIEYNPSDVKPQDIKRKITSMGYEVT